MENKVFVTDPRAELKQKVEHGMVFMICGEAYIVAKIKKGTDNIALISLENGSVWDGKNIAEKTVGDILKEVIGEFADENEETYYFGPATITIKSV